MEGDSMLASLKRKDGGKIDSLLHEIEVSIYCKAMRMKVIDLRPDVIFENLKNDVKCRHALMQVFFFFFFLFIFHFNRPC